MVGYIRQFTQELLRRLQADQAEQLHDRIAVLVEELNRLDPREFLPAAQLRFIETRLLARRLLACDQDEWGRRVEIRKKNRLPKERPNRTLEPKLANHFQTTDWMEVESRARQDPDALAKVKELEPLFMVEVLAFRMRDEQWQQAEEQRRKELDAVQPSLCEAEHVCREVLEVLDLFAGVGSFRTPRQFPFIRNADLKAIVERDYRELSLILFPSGAWKSTVMLAGSILEAILNDLICQNPAREQQAVKHLKRRKPTATIKSPSEWCLGDLIDVATDLSLLSVDRAQTIDKVVRDYRNFIHPRAEIRAGHPCSEAEAGLAKFALDGVCDYLSPPTGSP
jgi:hypothetical protein